MKIKLLLILSWLTTNLYSQNWYSKLFDPFNGRQEAASIMHLSMDTLIIRGSAPCISDEISCSILGKYVISQHKFIELNHYDNIQLGGRNLLVNSNNIFLSSQEAILNENISVSQLERSSLDFIKRVDLNIDDERYTSYTIKESIIFDNKLIIGSQVLDLEIFVPYLGWNNYQENAVLYVLDSLLNTDTILIIPPSSGAFIKIEDLAVGPDSVLYISFHERYLKDTTQDYLAHRNVIYGFNKEFQQIFEWIGHDIDKYETSSNLVISNDSSLFINYKRGYYTYLACLNIDGSLKWECLLDNTIGESEYYFKEIKLAANGDIIGVGAISSIINELGISGILFRIDSLGNLKWKRAFRVNKGFDITIPSDLPYQASFEDFAELPNGDLIMIGSVRKFVDHNWPEIPYNFDIWVVQASEEGCLWNDCPYIQDIVTKDRYIPIVYGGNEWVVDAISPTFPTAIHRYSFSLDSALFNDKYYFQLLYKSELQGPWKETGRFMREEGGKVFELSDNGSYESLMYDFNLQTGDTLWTHIDGSVNRRRVINVGVYNVFGENQRKTMTIECVSDSTATDTTMWIEGIGDLERLFWTSTFCSTSDREDSIAAIRCFLMDEQGVYVNPDLVGDCYITNVEEPEFNPVIVFPNPVSDVLNIVDENQIISRILLYNSLGVLVYAKNSYSVVDPVDVSKLPPGFYYGIIIFENKEMGNFKIMIVD